MKERISKLMHRLSREGVVCGLTALARRKFRMTGVGRRFAEESAQRSGRIVAVNWRGHETLFHLPLKESDWIQNIMFRSGEFYEVHDLITLQELIGPCDTVIDVGANIGNHALFFATHLPARRVVAFEPIPETFEMLRRNIDLNNKSHVVCAEALGVGHSNGAARISFQDRANTGLTSLSMDAEGSIRIIRLDDWFADFPHHIDLIKIDVEGFELNVLQGAQDLLKRHKPVVHMEIWRSSRTAVASQALLADLGYSEPTQIEPSGNWLFTHPEGRRSR